MDTLVTLQLSDQNHLIVSFLFPAMDECTNTGLAMGGFELDVERTLPSIPRHRVTSSWEDIAKRYAELGNKKRVGETICMFPLIKGQIEKWIALVENQSGTFGSIIFFEIHVALRFDLYMNVQYARGGDIGRRATGVAMLRSFPRYPHACREPRSMGT